MAAYLGKCISVDGINIDAFSIAKKEGFIKFVIQLNKQSIRGENYNSNVIEMVISGSKQDIDNIDYNVIIKYANTDEKLRFNVVEAMFNNEKTAYFSLIPVLHELQRNAGMDFIESFKVPRAIEISCEQYNEYLAMGDISLEGFEQYGRLKSLDYNHLRLLVTKIANYHGSILALKIKERGIFEDIVRRIPADVNLTNNDKSLFFLAESMKNSKNFLSNPQQLSLIEKTLVDLPKRLAYLTSRAAAEPYDVICHGDLWINNFWFKYDKDKEPTDICFFDWQLLRCGSLFSDLHYMIFICTDSETRQKYHSEIFDWYYADLGHLLRRFGLSVDDVYPKEAFKADERKFAPHALVITVAYTLGMTADSNNVADIGEILSHDAERLQKEFRKLTLKGRERIQNIISDYISYGYD